MHERIYILYKISFIILDLLFLKKINERLNVSIEVF